jgi:hypothetical protein
VQLLTVAGNAGDNGVMSGGAVLALARATMKRSKVVVLLAGILACSAGSSSTMDAAMADAASVVDASMDVFVTAAHPNAPTVVKSSGSVLTTPKVVVVTFDSEPLAAQVEAFAQAVGASAYWSATTSEYGVGAAQYAGAVHVASPPETTISQTALEAWLASQLDGTHPEWPTADASTIYTIVYPLFDGIEVDDVAPCEGSPAYHGQITLGSIQVPYAAINRCDPRFGLSGIDYVTAGLSHEWIEASTDPFYFTSPAYQSPAAQYNDWMFATGGELADMCTTTNSVYFQPPDLPYTVQRSWSNAAALAGHDPCVPAPMGAYFTSAPVMTDTLHGSSGGQAFTSEGVHVGLGQSVSIPVELFSDAETNATWSVVAQAVPAASLSFMWDATSGQNGDVLNLTVTRNADDPTLVGVDAFIVTSTLGMRQSAWVGAVGD